VVSDGRQPGAGRGRRQLRRPADHPHERAVDAATLSEHGGEGRRPGIAGRPMGGPQMSPTRSIAAAVAILALVAACSGTGRPAGQQAVAGTVAPSAPSPAGYWPVTIPAPLRGTRTTDIRHPGASNGTWVLRSDDHSLSLRNPSAPSADDFFGLNADRVDASSIHLADEQDCSAASYAWAVADGRLTLTTADDRCGDRRIILTSGP